MPFGIPAEDFHGGFGLSDTNERKDSSSIMNNKPTAKDILYDCYDENKRPIGIIFARDCKDLLEQCPNVAYVLGLDYLTRERVWHRVRENGLFPAK